MFPASASSMLNLRTQEKKEDMSEVLLWTSDTPSCCVRCGCVYLLIP